MPVALELFAFAEGRGWPGSSCTPATQSSSEVWRALSGTLEGGWPATSFAVSVHVHQQASLLNVADKTDSSKFSSLVIEHFSTSIHLFIILRKQGATEAEELASDLELADAS